MLRPLTALCYLCAAVVAQSRFYCDSKGTDAIREAEFYLITREKFDTGYTPGLRCQFRAQSNTSGFFLDIQTFSVSTAVLTISTDSRELFQDSRIDRHQASIAIASRWLQVRFDATGDFSYGEGVTIRVRALDPITGCPPGWTYLYGSCYGSSNTTGRLNFVDSQLACNSMRSNLLLVPREARQGGIGAFVRFLPEHLRTGKHYTWIGMTDATRQFKPHWLNGERQSEDSEIGCASGGTRYSACLHQERCGSLRDGSRAGAILMDRCASEKAFACSAPPGGTHLFYPVPSAILTASGGTSAAWICGVVISCLFLASMVVGGLVCRLRSRRRASRGSVSATSVAVTSGPAISPPAPPQYSQYPLEPPPYESVVQCGRDSAGRCK